MWLITFIGLVKPTLPISQTTIPSPTPYQPKNFIIYNGDRNKKLIALTFDADMTPKMKAKLSSGFVKSWYNKNIIDILRKNNVPATLFLTGMWAEIYPDATKDLANDPLFEIGNHSYSHPAFSFPCSNLKEISNSDDLFQIQKTQEILKNLTGKTPIYFRFPGGCFDSFDINAVHQQHLDIIQWDFASNDGFNKNADSISKRIINKVKPGSIIVMHMMGGPNAPETDIALPSIIKALEEKGYRFVKISDLLNQQ